MNKIFILGSILIGSILIVENFVLVQSGYVLIWYTNTGVLTVISMIIGAFLGFGIKGSIQSKDEDSDFNY